MGFYVADRFSVGGLNLENTVLAVVNGGHGYDRGILGLGLHLSEAVVSEDKYYYNLVDQMYLEGKIDFRCYSLYLGDTGKSSPSCNNRISYLLTSLSSFVYRRTYVWRI